MPGVSRDTVQPIVLAAGSASRFGSDKLLARTEGRPLLDHVLATVTALSRLRGVARPTVVVGPAHEGRITLARRWPVHILVVRQAGLGDSLRVAARRHRGVALLVCLGDMPWVETRTLQRMLASWWRRPCGIVRPRAARSAAPGPPVLLGREAARALHGLVGDRGLRIPPGHGRVLQLPHDGRDVDVPADLVRR